MDTPDFTEEDLGLTLAKNAKWRQENPEPRTQNPEPRTQNLQELKEEGQSLFRPGYRTQDVLKGSERQLTPTFNPEPRTQFRTQHC